MENDSFIPLRELEFDLLANFGINARTFQFYKSEGLIPPPKRMGKNTGYNKEYLYKVLVAVKKLQDNFHLSISELKPIIKYSISERLLGRLHKDLKQLENDFPIIWPESINDGEGWGTVYINRKIRRLYLLTWQLCYGKKYIPPYSIEAIEALVKHETVTESGFKYKIETGLALLDAGEISYEELVKEIKKMEKLPRRANWR